MGLILRISNYILTKVFIIMSFWQFFYKSGCESQNRLLFPAKNVYSYV